MKSKEKGQLVWEVAMEQGPINLDPIATGIGRRNMQIRIQFPQRSDDPGMLPWTL